ncbi:MAG: M14 family zinc carboxypeptidase [Bdellovibrionales bacterium]
MRILFALLIFCPPLFAQTADQPLSAEAVCREDLALIPGKLTAEETSALCSKMQHLPNCASEQGRPILHYERMGTTSKGRRILAMSLIHGDELPSGAVTRSWIQRLEKIEPRNSWRVIPVANPDGLRSKSRTNSKGVDLNRNFPTKEWVESALKSWVNLTKSDPRRYPGPSSASEAETKCLLQHFEAFKPDFIISIHTPIGVLDFDGPPVRVPKASPLPWSPLGNFPGSLGRYMWKDNNIPVLTIELKGNSGAAKLEQIDHLQDISGSIAIEANQKRPTEVKN